MKTHSTKQVHFLFPIFIVILFLISCSSNEENQAKENVLEERVDSTLLVEIFPDSCQIDTVIEPVEVAQMTNDLVAATGKIEAVDIDSLNIKVEKEDKKVGKAAGGSVGQRLQNAFNHISNDGLNSREKRGIIKGIQKKFLDMREDRVFVTSIEGNNNEYGIGEYLRRLKGYEVIKVRIEKLQLAQDTLVANITVKEVKK